MKTFAYTLKQAFIQFGRNRSMSVISIFAMRGSSPLSLWKNNGKEICFGFGKRSLNCMTGVTGR